MILSPLVLLDAHVSASNHNNIRLDHYIYTEESFRESKQLLNKDGVITVVFEPINVWMAARIYGLLKKVFGEVPYVFRMRIPGLGWGGVMFVTGNNIKKNKKLYSLTPTILAIYPKKDY